MGHIFQDSRESIDILVSPACLPWPTEPDEVEDQDRGIILGWGRTSNDKVFASQVSLHYDSTLLVSYLLSSFQNQQKFQAATSTLQALSVPKIDDEICKEYFPLKDNFCAGGEEGKSYTYLAFYEYMLWNKKIGTYYVAFSGKDSCGGDSGGAFVTRINANYPWYQSGIVSYGSDRCGVGIPGVFTKVSNYLDWIARHLKP